MTHTTITAKKLLRYGSLTLLGVVMFSYSLFRSHDLLFGIRLHVSGISSGQTVSDSVITVSGKAPRAAAVTIDGRAVALAEDGTWKDQIVLLPGYNSVHIAAADKFGRDVSDQFTVYYAAPKTEPAPAPCDTECTASPEPDMEADTPSPSKPNVVSFSKTKVTTD